MTYLSTEIVRKQLRALSGGKKSQVPIRVLAQFILDLGCGSGDLARVPEPKAHDDSVQFLTRMYALKDPRSG
jgi:ubiquinone/menaquinone biosynthesis C-methylase UbiE